MMILRTNFLLLFTSLLLHRASPVPTPMPDCGEIFITDKTDVTCGSTGTNTIEFSNSDYYQINPAASQLTIDVVLEPKVTCAAKVNYELFMLQFYPGSQIMPVKLLYLGWEDNAKMFYVMGSYVFSAVASFSMLFQSYTTSPTISSLTSTNIEFSFTVDLRSGYVGLGLAVKGDGTNSMRYTGYLSSVAYGYDWYFDSTTKFIICSDSTTNTVHVNCDVKSLSLFYRYAGDEGVFYFGGLYPVQIAEYTLNSGGSSITPSFGSLGTTPFASSTSPPSWVSTGVGLKFSASSQYLDLPYFPIEKSTILTQASLTVSFWLRFKSASASGDFIFQYSSSDFSTVKLGLKIDDGGYLIGIASAGALIQTTTDPVPKEVWRYITVSFAISDKTYNNYNFIHIFINSMRVSTSSSLQINTPLLPFLPSDVFRLGGPNTFLGLLNQLRIFTPGAVLITDPSECSAATTNCAVNLGVTDGKCLAFYTPCTKAGCTICMVGPGSLELCLACDVDYTLEGSDCKPPYVPPDPEPETDTESGKKGTSGKRSDEDFMNGVQMAANIATKVGVALSPGNSFGISITVAGKIFSNIKFLNISYSDELSQALKTWTSDFFSLGFDIDVPEEVQRVIPEAAIPYVFTKYEVPASFLLNLYQQLIIFLAILGFSIVMQGLEVLLRRLIKKSKLHSFVKSVRISSQNFILTGLYGLYGDIILYSTLEYRSLDVNAGISSISLVISGLLLILMFLGFFFQIRFLFKFCGIKNKVYEDEEQKERAIEALNKQNEGIEVLFTDFNDQTIHQLAFIFYLTIRDLAYSLILTTLFEYPIIQTVFTFSFSIIMMVYLYAAQPFKSRFSLFQQVFYELIWLAVNVSVLILAIMDEINASTWNARKKIGKLVIIVNYIFNFACLLFVMICLAGSAKEAYENLKKKKMTTTLKKGMKEDFPLRNRKLNEGPRFSNMTLQRSVDSSLEVSNIALVPRNEHSKLEFNTSSIDILEENSFQGEYLPQNIRKQARGRPRLVLNNSSKIITGPGVNSISTVEGRLDPSSSSPNLRGFERGRKGSGDGNIDERTRIRQRKVRMKNVQEERVEVPPPHLRNLFVVKKGRFVLK